MSITPLNTQMPVSPLSTATDVRSHYTAQQRATSVDGVQATLANAEQKEISNEQLEAAVKAANEFVALSNSALQFIMDKEIQKVVVKLVDKATNEVIRQVPSEDMIAMTKKLDKIIKGFVLEQSV